MKSSDEAWFKYSGHALQRMAQREVDPNQIELTVLEPDVEMPGAKPNRRRVYKAFKDGRKLEVIYKPKPNNGYLIVTVYWR